MSKIHPCNIVIVCLCFAFPVQVQAQSTPSEFAELSLQALLGIDIDDEEKETNATQRWTFAFQFKAAEFEGYLDGTKELSFDEVLYSSNDEERTDSNFPVVPTVINQYVKVISIGYQMSPKLQLAARLPLIRQTTDHISSVPDYPEFLIASEDMGDVVLTANYRLVDSGHHHWWITSGLSFPTGSIDKVGDTPRAPGNQQLPFTMQLGSGTYDVPVELSYQSTGEYDFNISLSATIRLGRNDRNYRLGNNYDLRGKYRFKLADKVKLYGALELSYAEKITGQDDETTIPGDFPYSSGITNPNLFGGAKVSVSAGALWDISESVRIDAEFSKPIYQDLNGPQPKELWKSGIQLAYRF